jgi:hypothetical protein
VLQLDPTGTGQSHLLLGRHFHADLAGNRPRNLALQCQNVAQIALIALGPELLIGLRLDQLRRDPHPVARAQH